MPKKKRPLQNERSNFCTWNLFSLFSVLWRSCWMWWPWGICHSSVSVLKGTYVFFNNAVPLLCLLQISTRWCTWTAQALLQHMGICRLYPLVVILFCLNDLEAKLLVKVNSWLIADLHMTVEKKNLEGQVRNDHIWKNKSEKKINLFTNTTLEFFFFLLNRS